MIRGRHMRTLLPLLRGTALRSLRAKTAPVPTPRLIDRLSGPGDDMTLLLLEDPTSGLLVVNRAGRIVLANAALRRMLGREQEPSAGEPAEMIFADEARETTWEAEVVPVLAGRPLGSTPRSFTAQLVTTGVAAATVSVSVTALRERDGEVSGAILRLSDITQVKLLESQLASSQKLQAVGQLAGGIAHDFNNLLTAVIGAADSITERTTDPETREDAASVRASAIRGGGLVRQLLAFGRQQTLQPQTLAANAVIADLTDLLRRLLGSHIELVMDLEEPGRLVRADPTQLDQVLVNLAVNARDAMADGGTLTLRSGHVTLYRPLPRGPETIPPGRYVMIEVQDTGHGIPPGVMSRIFDPFFTTKADSGGHGLGLSTVLGIVRQSDGYLIVESEVGRGTRVRVYLPRYDGADRMGIPRVPRVEAPQEPVPEPPRPVARHATPQGLVLLVEDEEPVRRLAERAMRRAGWEVLSADCGEAALAFLDPPPTDLRAIVTDVVMPGLDGPAVVRAVRERLGRPALPAILVSGYAQEAARRDLDAVATTFLPKPYVLKDLVARLGQVVTEASVDA